MEEKKGPGGRPTLYREEYCDKAVELMTKGYSKEAVAGALGVSKQCLYEWIEKHQEFGDAIKKGETASQLFWEGLGIQGIILGKSETFAQGAWAFNMKARFKWAEIQRIEANHELKLSYNLDDEKEEE